MTPSGPKWLLMYKTNNHSLTNHDRDLIHTRPTTNGTNSVRTHLGTLLALAIGPEVVKLVRHRYGSATLLIESEQGLDQEMRTFLSFFYIFSFSLWRERMEIASYLLYL